ncbi:MAG: cysteine-rich CWC family protein [Acidobacteria bacterium]|nr:cysteine-rich CWC family protein [Acidobacteriota bacterium]MDA1233899.1 cysteine-rich CWC family protein [Acidobacteriota bacterium]
MKDPANCDEAGNKETCASCGAEFGCEPTGNCWCFSETVPKETLEAIKDRYERCLCPACLRKAVTAV